jgi:hypothetical protein
MLLAAAPVYEFARQLCISCERCRKYNVSGLLKGASLVFTPSFAINRYDISDPENWQDVLLQELAEFAAAANNQYRVAILRSHQLT